MGKSHALPFKQSNSNAKNLLELIHTDLWGLALVTSTVGKKIYVAFLDDFSRHTWLYPLKTKGEALQVFLQFKILVENQFDKDKNSSK